MDRRLLSMLGIVWVFEYLDLEFTWNLEFVIWDL